MKFKIGDKVRTKFGNGEIVFIQEKLPQEKLPQEYLIKIKGFDGHDGGYGYDNKDGLRDKWWFSERELELSENKEVVEIDLKRDLIKLLFKEDFRELFLKIIDFVEEINGRYGIEIETSEVAEIIVEEYKEICK